MENIESKSVNLDDGVIIQFIKDPDVENCKIDIKATTSTAAVNGLAIVTKRMADMLDIPAGQLLCVLATVLMGPVHKEGSAEDAERYDGES